MIIPDDSGKKTDQQELSDRVDAIQDRFQRVLNILGGNYEKDIHEMKSVTNPTKEEIDRTYRAILEHVSVGFLVRQIINKTMGLVDTHIRKQRSISLLAAGNAINSVAENAVKQMSNIGMAISAMDPDAPEIDHNLAESDALAIIALSMYKLNYISQEELDEILDIVGDIDKTMREAIDNNE